MHDVGYLINQLLICHQKTILHYLLEITGYTINGKKNKNESINKKRNIDKYIKVQGLDLVEQCALKQ